MTDKNAETRTIVISDAHGCPQLIEAALAASGYRRGVDRLLYAGDFLDRGSRAAECLESLEAAGAEILWGNHEVAALLAWPIWPQNEESPAFRSLLLSHLLAGDWQLVACVQGVLVSHAGLSAAWASRLERFGGDPIALAARVNQEFRAAAAAWLLEGPPAELPRVFGELGPLWLRPDAVGTQGLLPGVVQVAGHTPLEGVVVDDLRKAGLFLVDPGVDSFLGELALPSWRYAMIDGDHVEVMCERPAVDAFS